MNPDFLRVPLRHRFRRRASGVAAGEQAAAEKCALKRAVAVHAAAAEAGGFADGIEPRYDLAVAAEYPRREVGLETAQSLAGQDVEAHRDQRPLRGIENPVRRRGAYQAVADVFARIVDVHHLRVLDVRIGDLTVARLDLGLEVIELE